MISVPIRISTQEVIDFPKEKVVINNYWKDIIDPSNDDTFKRKRVNKRRKTA